MIKSAITIRHFPVFKNIFNSVNPWGSPHQGFAQVLGVRMPPLAIKPLSLQCPKPCHQYLDWWLWFDTGHIGNCVEAGSPGPWFLLEPAPFSYYRDWLTASKVQGTTHLFQFFDIKNHEILHLWCKCSHSTPKFLALCLVHQGLLL